MARAGPIVAGPARFGSYRTPSRVPASAAQQHGAASASAAMAAVTSYPSSTPSFFGRRKIGVGPPQREEGRWQVGIGVLRSTRLRAAGGLGTERTGLGTEQ
jgi:hypothetical protein